MHKADIVVGTLIAKATGPIGDGMVHVSRKQEVTSMVVLFEAILLEGSHEQMQPKGRRKCQE